MLYREIIAVCSQIHTKHINTLCGQNVELLNVKLGGTYSDHWALEGCDVFDAVNQGQPIKKGLPVSTLACGCVRKQWLWYSPSQH